MKRTKTRTAHSRFQKANTIREASRLPLSLVHEDNIINRDNIMAIRELAKITQPRMLANPLPLNHFSGLIMAVWYAYTEGWLTEPCAQALAVRASGLYIAGLAS